MNETEQDPGLSPEGATDGAIVADPPATQEKAEGAEGAGTDSQQQKSEAAAEEFDVVIEGDKPKVDQAPKDSAAWARIRKEAAELRAENAELKRQQEAKETPKIPDPGPEPDLEDPDVAYDKVKLREKTIRWHEARKAQEAEQVRLKAEAAKRDQEWEGRRQLAAKARETLASGMPGYVEAESIANAALDDAQKRMIIKVCGEKAPSIFAALGRDPVRLKDLSGEKDYAMFIAKIAKLEDKVQIQKRSATPPAPEKTVNGTGSKAGAVDKREEELRAEAHKTGKFGDLHKYRMEKRRAERSQR